MAGRGDRQKLGQALDDAEDDGGSEQGGEHVLVGAAVGRQRLPNRRGVADRGACQSPLPMATHRRQLASRLPGRCLG